MCMTIYGVLPCSQLYSHDFHKHFFKTFFSCLYILANIFSCMIASPTYKKSITKVIVSQIATSHLKFKIKPQEPQLHSLHLQNLLKEKE